MRSLVVPLLLAVLPCAGTGPVEIVSDIADPRLEKSAAAIAAIAWKEACTLYGVDPKGPDKPVTLHLYREVADYEKACDRTGNPNLKRNLAFSDPKDFTAHVVCQPTLGGEAQAQLAPTWQTLRLVAHETAHLARFSELPNQNSHPEWFIDGNASFVEMKALQLDGRLASPGSSPYFSTGEARVKALLHASTLPSVDDLLHDRTDTLSFDDRYFVRLAWFRFLIEGRRATAFRKFLDDLRRLGGGGDFTERAAAALQKELGVADWNAVEADFHAWIEALKPEWEERGRSLETEADVWTQTAFDERNAVAFRTEPAGAKSYAIAGTVTTLADRKPASQANLLLGRQIMSGGEYRFVSVAIVPGAGVTLFEYDESLPAADQWKRLGGGGAKETAAGKPLAFRVDCTPNGRQTEIAVTIDGKVAAKATIARLLDGPFGVGAQAGCSCIWRGVKRAPATKN